MDKVQARILPPASVTQTDNGKITTIKILSGATHISFKVEYEITEGLLVQPQLLCCKLRLYGDQTWDQLEELTDEKLTGIPVLQNHEWWVAPGTTKGVQTINYSLLSNKIVKTERFGNVAGIVKGGVPTRRVALECSVFADKRTKIGQSWLVQMGFLKTVRERTKKDQSEQVISEPEDQFSPNWRFENDRRRAFNIYRGVIKRFGMNPVHDFAQLGPYDPVVILKKEIDDFWEEVLQHSRRSEWGLTHVEGWLRKAKNYMELMEPFDEAAHERQRAEKLQSQQQQQQQQHQDISLVPYWSGGRPKRYETIDNMLDRASKDARETKIGFLRYESKPSRLRKKFKSSQIPGGTFDELIKAI